MFSGCTSLSTVIFSGEAPAIGENAFMGITATVNYPAGLDSWTEEVMQQYGGTITWKATGHPDGWALEEGLWYYYADGEAVTGWQFVGVRGTTSTTVASCRPVGSSWTAIGTI